MKKASRHHKIPSLQEIIDYKFKCLRDIIKDEIRFGVPSYEDGSLNVQHGLETIFKKVMELDQLMNQFIDKRNLSKQTIQPPATPESLDEISEAIE
jgi:hypothetical protein